MHALVRSKNWRRFRISDSSCGRGKTTVAAHLPRHCAWDTLPVLHPAAANENKAAAQSKTHYAFVTTPTQHPAADKNGYNGCTIEIALRPYILALCVEDY
jgi:hypothetical protein